QLSPDQTTVVSITVAGSTTQGVFFDAGKKTITVTMMTRQGQENKTFTVAKDARGLLDGKAATLQDLKEGTQVYLTFAAGEDGHLVIQIRNTPPAAPAPPRPRNE